MNHSASWRVIRRPYSEAYADKSDLDDDCPGAVGAKIPNPGATVFPFSAIARELQCADLHCQSLNMTSVDTMLSAAVVVRARGYIKACFPETCDPGTARDRCSAPMLALAHVQNLRALHSETSTWEVTTAVRCPNHACTEGSLATCF